MTRVDKLVIGFAVLLVTGLYASLWTPATPGSTLEIRAGDGSLQEISLDQPQELHVKGHLGESVIRIEDGRARFVSSPCTNKHCIHFGWLGDTGQTAACVPNGVLISVGNAHGEAPRYDAINL